ncbi:hypothetical protein NITGR_950047 [Nitrospina gracilis 3/211]|uniref:L-2-amino-thiazoline-4-carboxylic acid hydrolase n=1 Tax=Nitrospina gracilis (strain 3/211) TaxID=1266370 RepID=M1Z2X6_NITG3|nr:MULTISPECIES: L-2-amino-thiazoline-4-carboxylic acid hydrolase [Nitrospina]MCF8724814.1 hypothetical protein [Nitrospina sp. Nb-3]CCQ92089.1 hypothetical protein NITGR_950047 [Nitrospina gracilis 3/211]
MSENPEQTETQTNASERIEPMLAHLKVGGQNIDLDRIRAHFNQMWEFENGDNLSEEEQYLTTIGLFIYTCHNALDDYSINVMRARQYITDALTAWLAPETDKQVAEEKASDNPFKTFVEKEQPRAEDYFSWRHFLLEVKKASDKEFQFKMKSCWFHSLFIRLGRADYIETACNFDRIPAEARTDYVNLKLNNTFAKLGTFCQFRYTPSEGE